jgi:hypothetical protein
MVTVSIISALICFSGSCWPALIGNDTPRGEFVLEQFSVQDKRYGGDLLAFKFTKTKIYAIHRVLDIPNQQRLSRIRSPHSEHRIGVTSGCVNIEPNVYEKLVECCSNDTLVIK